MSKIKLNEFWPYKIAVLADLVSRKTMSVVKSYSDLNLSQWRVLAALGDKDGRTAAEVVAMTPMDKGIVSRAVTSLDERGLLKRVEDTQDKRRRTLHLTKSGKAHYDVISKNIQAALVLPPQTNAPEPTNKFINTLDAYIIALTHELKNK